MSLKRFEEEFVLRSILEGNETSQPGLRVSAKLVLLIVNSAVDLLNKTVFRACNGSAGRVLIELADSSVVLSETPDRVDPLQSLVICLEGLSIGDDSHAAELDMRADSNPSVLEFRVVEVVSLLSSILSLIN